MSTPATITFDELDLTDAQYAAALEELQQRIAYLADGQHPTAIHAEVGEKQGQVTLSCDDPHFDEALQGVSKILRVLVSWRRVDQAVRAKLNAEASELTIPVRLSIELEDAAEQRAA